MSDFRFIWSILSHYRNNIHLPAGSIYHLHHHFPHHFHETRWYLRYFCPKKVKMGYLLIPCSLKSHYHASEPLLRIAQYLIISRPFFTSPSTLFILFFLLSFWKVLATFPLLYPSSFTIRYRYGFSLFPF